MDHMMKTLVMKFGGAALKTATQFSKIAKIIQDRKEKSLVVVVSAMGGFTNALVSLAHQVAKKPSKREVDMLLSVGERVSMSLLAMVLEEEGIPAVSLTGSQSGIITSQDHGAAFIKEVRPGRVKQHLSEGKVVIVGGFQGVSEEREITTLGRGGSDTSAVALGVALQAERVEFYKDVPGVFSKDPKKHRDAHFLSQLTFEEALSFSEFVLHKRAVLLAAKNHLPLQIKSFEEKLREECSGTWIRSKERGGTLQWESP